MSKSSVLIQERMTVGAHTIDIQRSRINDGRQSIILVHGIGVSSRYFIPLAEQLAATYNVFAIDLPGYGRTPKPQRALNIIQLAEFVVQATEQLGLQSSVILGHSMGCQIVAHAVKKRPQLYAKMILLAPTVYRHERSLFMQTVRLMQDTMYEPIKASCVIFPDYLRMGMGRYLTTCRYMLDDRIEETLPQCIIPGLIMRGMRDKIAPEEWVKFLDIITPHSMLRHVNKAPHALQLSRAEAVAGMCRDFIEG